MYGSSHRARPNRDWNVDHPVVAAQAEASSQGVGGRPALAFIGIAAIDRPLRQAVKAHHQPVAASFALPVATNRRRQCVEPASVIVEATNESQVGQVAPATERRGQGVENSGRGGRGELRIQRDDEQPGEPALLQFARERRRSMAGRSASPCTTETSKPCSPSVPRSRLAWRCEIVTCSGDPSVVQIWRYLGRSLARTRPQDEAVENRPPGEPRDLDHARVRQELLQVAPDGAGSGVVGRAELHQQHGASAARMRWEEAVGSDAVGSGAFGAAAVDAAWLVIDPSMPGEALAALRVEDVGVASDPAAG